MADLSPKELAQLIVTAKSEGQSRDDIISNLKAKGIDQDVATTYIDLVEKTMSGNL